MGCIHSVRRSRDRRDSDSDAVESLTIKRRVTKVINGKPMKISISVVAEPCSSFEERPVKKRPASVRFHDDTKTLSDFDVRGQRRFRTMSFMEGKRFTKFPNHVGYKMCLSCNSHGDDVIKTKAVEGDKDLCRSCSVKTREKTKKTSHKKRLPELSGISKTNVNVSAFANLLALTALDLTAPASDAILRNRKNTWIQLAGHQGGFAPAGPNTIWKKMYTKDNNEALAYEKLMEDVAHTTVPIFYREVEYNSENFIEIEDLLQHFSDPNIMDVKMGTRTFLESEVRNPVQRKDLYEKMVALDPCAPTPEEQENKSVTKLRYMQFREQGSSSLEFGFRIEALRISGDVPSSNLKKVKSREQLNGVLSKFIHSAEVRVGLLRRLEEIRDVFTSSSYFRTHEIIGSSLLLLHDKSGKCGAWIIDFSKTIPVDEGTEVNHRSPWQLGNHEDGFLFGLDNLINLIRDLEKSTNLSGNEAVVDRLTNTTSSAKR